MLLILAERTKEVGARSSRRLRKPALSLPKVVGTTDPDR